MEKVIMIHYLLADAEKDIQQEIYKKKVQKEHPEFKHLFFPSKTREGIEIVRYEDNKTNIL